MQHKSILVDLYITCHAYILYICNVSLLDRSQVVYSAKFMDMYIPSYERKRIAQNRKKYYVRMHEIILNVTQNK